MRRVALVALGMWLSCVGAARADGDGWIRAGGTSSPHASVHYVLMDASRIQDRRSYFDAVVDLCGNDPSPLCQIFFWDDAGLIPARFPLAEAQAAGVLAKYWRNDRSRLRALEPWRADITWK